MPPERLITPTPFGIPGLNHCRALSARPPIMPTTALPGPKTPSVFGPTNIAPFALAAAAICIASQTGTRSGTSTVSLIPASIAEIAASFTPAAGTKRTEMSILPNELTASCGVLKTGTPRTFSPPLPGVTPATTFVPYSRINRVRARPSRPVIPWTSTRFVSSIKIAISARLHDFVQARNFEFEVKPFNAVQATLDRARQQFGVLVCELLCGQRDKRRVVAIHDYSAGLCFDETLDVSPA